METTTAAPVHALLGYYYYQQLVLELSTSELETAARTSYAYWWYVTQEQERQQSSPTQELHQQQQRCADNNNDVDNDATSNNGDDEAIPIVAVEQLRLSAAKREARRHYVGCNRDYTKAVASLRHAIHLRDTHQVDLLRWIGTTQEPPQQQQQQRDALLNVTERERLHLYREYICDELDKQMMAVVGVDEESRAIVFKGTRTNSSTDVRGYFIVQVYVAERAMALTEVASRGRQDRLYCIFDFADYSSQHAPPTLALRGALVDLQAMYKERLYQLVVLDPPFFLNLIYNVISPFLDPVTRKKIKMASGQAERSGVVHGSPVRERALSFLLLDTDEYDYGVQVETFLHEISFHEYYDLSATFADVHEAGLVAGSAAL